MGLPRQPLSPVEEDLESTAELPALDLAACEATHADGLSATDRWVQPPLSEPEPEATGSTRDLAATLRAAEELLQRQSARVAQLETDRSTLHEQLDAESATVRRLEHRLAERDLAAQALEARGAELAGEAERLRTEMARLREALAMRTALVEQREAALAEAQEGAAAAAGRAVQDEQRRTGLESEVAELRRRTTAYLEALQSNLGRRDVYESACAELEARIVALEIELRASGERAQLLEGDLAKRASDLALVEERAEAQAVAGEGAAAALERVEASRAELESSCRELSGQRDVAQDEAAGLRTQLRELEERLRAADESAVRLEEQSRVSLEQMQQTLGEREARIGQLESAAAGQAAALGDLQQSLQRIDSLAQSGADIPPQGARRLLIRSDGDSEVVHVLGRRTTIGRTPDNDLQLDTKFISRHHAVILAGPVQTIIEDLGSTNGVLVNDRRIQRRALKDGDRVVVGKTAFRFMVRPTDASS